MASHTRAPSVQIPLGVRGRRGAVLTAGERVWSLAIQTVASIVLMRLLAPSDFGVVAMCAVIVNFIQVFADVGIGEALIQEPDLREGGITGVFLFSVLLGAGLSLAVWLGAPLASEFFRNDAITPLIRVLGIGLLFGAVQIVPRSLLLRQLRFGYVAATGSIAVTLGTAIAIVGASHGFGAWSLVVQTVAAQFAMLLMFLLGAGWRPRSAVDVAATRRLARFGLRLAGFNFINYWARSSDNLLVGRYIGAAALGLYARAYGFLLLPVSQIAGVLGRVMIPVMASMRGDTTRVARTYIRAIDLMLFVTLPMMSGLCVVAPEFVLVMFGTNWGGLDVLIRIFCVSAVPQILCNPTGWIYIAQGRSDLMLRWGSTFSAVIVFAIAAGVIAGSVESVAIAYTAATWIIMIPTVSLAVRVIGLRSGAIFARLLAPGCRTAAMVTVVTPIHVIFARVLSHEMLLLIEVVAGATVYMAVAIVTRAPEVREIWLAARALFGAAAEPVGSVEEATPTA